MAKNDCRRSEIKMKNEKVLTINYADIQRSAAFARYCKRYDCIWRILKLNREHTHAI